MIVSLVENYWTNRISQWPINSNRASEIGHECLRYLVLLRTRWEEKTLHDMRLQAIFEEGNMHEKAVLTLLAKAGIAVTEQQRAFQWRKYNLTGHIDCKIAVNGESIPTEIKGLSPYSWDVLNTVEDMRSNKRHYIRKYPAQLTCYLLMDDKEKGLFILKNKLTGQLKELWVHLDYDLGEDLIQKCEIINEHVEKETFPACIPYDEDICGECGFIHICLPEVKRDALEIQTDPELESDIERWFELKLLKGEYDKLDKSIKKRVKEQEKVVIGNYLITGKWIERDAYTVKTSKYWKPKIQRLGGKNG